MRLAKFGCLGVRRWITRQILSCESSNLPLEAAGVLSVQGCRGALGAGERNLLFLYFPSMQVKRAAAYYAKIFRVSEVTPKAPTPQQIWMVGAKPCETAYQLCKS